jgi:hypothetical protein
LHKIPSASPGESATNALPNGCTEHVLEGLLSGDAEEPGLTLVITFRIAPDSPVVRFRYELVAQPPSAVKPSESGASPVEGFTAEGGCATSCVPSPRHTLTKSAGRDALAYAAVSLASLPEAAELRLSEFTEIYHTYLPQEVPLAPRDFAAERAVMGPILLASDATHQFLLAYEHGSTYPDAFLDFALAPDRRVTLRAVKGNYCAGQALESAGAEGGFQSVWFDTALVAGTRDDLAAHFRHFIRARQALDNESRQPHVFYNTWNYQERKKHWMGRPYLDEMHEERMLRGIDAAHRIGIDVFVIDTGWYSRTGDWQVNLDRFPDGLKSVKARLDSYGMRLGLWFDNAAALSSTALRDHLDCRCSSHGKAWDPQPVWETEPSHRMCLVSRYWERFADELIRLHREVGVSYFKWDAIGQYGCDDPGHAHGTAAHSQATAFDRWIPLNLFMAHYLPDDGPQNQTNAVASLILGQNGIWGDLPGVSAEGQTLLCNLIGKYKQVRDAIAAASPVVTGRIGGNPEIHEKIAASPTLDPSPTAETKRQSSRFSVLPPTVPAPGKGAVVIFATDAGTYEYVTQASVDAVWWATPGVEVTRLPDGRAHIRATFHGHAGDGAGGRGTITPDSAECAKIVFFGVSG